MACERNRIIDLINYITSFGIEVNIGKNKARGNKGFFRTNDKNFRIDISKNISEEETLGILVHEFMHFVHYKYDKTLKSLDFIFKNYNELYESELINLTVDLIPKKSISPLFEQKGEFKGKIKKYSTELKRVYSDFSLSEPYKPIEKKVSKYDFKYLLKYDKIRVLKGFSTKIYSIQILEDEGFNDKDILNYLKLRSAQRMVKRINSKISRLNRYYNSPTELLARSFEYYTKDNEAMKIKAPNIYDRYNRIVNENEISIIADMVKIIQNK